MNRRGFFKRGLGLLGGIAAAFGKVDIAEPKPVDKVPDTEPGKPDIQAHCFDPSVIYAAKDGEWIPIGARVFCEYHRRPCNCFNQCGCMDTTIW